MWDDLGNLLVGKYLTLHTNTKIDTTIDLSYVYLKYIYTDDTKFEMSKKKNLKIGMESTLNYHLI